MNPTINPSVLKIIRTSLLRDLLLNQESQQVGPLLLTNEPMQVLLFSPYKPDFPIDHDSLVRLLHAAGLHESETEIIPMKDYTAVILKGNAPIQRITDHVRNFYQAYSDSYRTDPWMEKIFTTFGCIVDSPKQLYQSYQQAHSLMDLRFFCDPNQVVFFEYQLQNRSQLDNVITPLLQEKYVGRLLQYIQTFNRTFTAGALQELQQMVTNSNSTVDEIRIFFIDLYLQIKEQMKYLYQGYTIPFYSNSFIIDTIMNATYLSEIIIFLTNRIDIIMSAIGASSRESVLDDILHYIQHNFTSNITLENIAPLFGYNHSYLGKIFHKKIGMSFNEYVDRLRIERAMNLLLTEKAKVYVVSEQVGYKNVDYFHLKFRKYVNMSPMEYRKANQ